MSTERPALGERIAWTYLATVASAAVGGLVAVIAYQVVNPLACPITDPDEADLALNCSLVWATALMLISFAGVLVGALFLVRLDHKLASWLAMVAGLLGLLIGLDGLGQWWWILLLVLLPGLAAVVSAPWKPQARSAQVMGLAVLVVATLSVLVWRLAVG